jgi:hypothetical protein
MIKGMIQKTPWKKAQKTPWKKAGIVKSLGDTGECKVDGMIEGMIRKKAGKKTGL